jgi:hypothetical protein
MLGSYGICDNAGADIEVWPGVSAGRGALGGIFRGSQDNTETDPREKGFKALTGLTWPGRRTCDTSWPAEAFCIVSSRDSQSAVCLWTGSCIPSWSFAAVLFSVSFTEQRCVCPELIGSL